MNRKLENIKFVITDVDGVLTDGQLHYDANGEAIKSFHVRDGLGVKMLMESGIPVAVLSGRDSAILRKRIADLGIKLAFLGKLEKESACYELMKEVGVTPEETAYIGDDSVDLPAFNVCGVAFAVADAPDYVKDCADYVLDLRGGKGAFREMSDMILKAQGKTDVYSSAKGFLKIVTNMAQ
ncbi:MULTISPECIES: KdsC family phosphatase [Basfia]|nr:MULTISPECIES: HAD family hydrolase [Basfia]QIM68379.1 3-deoxy-D-manno-octulosonate 8-phosphate phosphatase [Basfia succiniciproducens]SCX90680.1 3-deoxy-D-manno-octulosonate 8-phosphate phosphatase (KDO 8-P phosphatase) [Basfia succiniciproducens]SEQ55729.1 3-deoxy-D-manno-octulosonate 8-phosphate phosphatase (KDO 8-P phosphatase) [Basfia succiniciproducens]